MSIFANILIIGTPRSGTLFTTQVLNKLGLKTSHEKIADNVVSWNMAFSDYMMTRRHREDGKDMPNHYSWKDFRKVLHQVRDPIKCIESMHVWDDLCWWEMGEKIPIGVTPQHPVPTQDELTLRCMKAYYYWNKRCESISQGTFRVESIKEDFDSFLKLIECTNGIGKDFFSTEFNYNTKDDRLKFGEHMEKFNNRFRNVSWNLLYKVDKDLTKNIAKMVRGYGYDY